MDEKKRSWGAPGPAVVMPSADEFLQQYQSEPMPVHHDHIPMLIITPNEVVLGMQMQVERERSPYVYDPYRPGSSFHRSRRDRDASAGILTLKVQVVRHSHGHDPYSRGMGYAAGLTNQRGTQRQLMNLARHIPKTLLDFVAHLNEPAGLHNLAGIARGFKDWWYR